MKLKANIAVSETGFLFDPSTGESFNLNKSGLYILKLLKDINEEVEILETVKKNFDVDETILQRYMDDFIRMLGQFNLLEQEDH